MTNFSRKEEKLTGVNRFLCCKSFGLIIGDLLQTETNRIKSKAKLIELNIVVSNDRKRFVLKKMRVVQRDGIWRRWIGCLIYENTEQWKVLKEFIKTSIYLGCLCKKNSCTPLPCPLCEIFAPLSRSWTNLASNFINPWCWCSSPAHQVELSVQLLTQVIAHLPSWSLVAWCLLELTPLWNPRFPSYHSLCVMYIKSFIAFRATPLCCAFFILAHSYIFHCHYLKPIKYASHWLLCIDLPPTFSLTHIILLMNCVANAQVQLRLPCCCNLNTHYYHHQVPKW